MRRVVLLTAAPLAGGSPVPVLWTGLDALVRVRDCLTLPPAG